MRSATLPDPGGHLEIDRRGPGVDGAGRDYDIGKDDSYGEPPEGSAWHAARALRRRREASLSKGDGLAMEAPLLRRCDR